MCVGPVTCVFNSSGATPLPSQEPEDPERTPLYGEHSGAEAEAEPNVEEVGVSIALMYECAMSWRCPATRYT